MRFFVSSLLAVAALASSVFAAENPISKPDGSAPLVAGEPTTITWTPTTAGPITLKLRQGPSGNLVDVLVIVGGAANSGSFVWTPSKDLPAGENYAIQITDDKTTDTNFTPLLVIKSDSAPKPSSSGTGTSSTSATSSASGNSSSASVPSTTSKAETTTKPAHSRNATSSTMITSTNGTITTSAGPTNDTITTPTGGSNSTKPYPTSTNGAGGTTGGSGPSSTARSTPASTAPSSGAVSLVMNSPLALVVCVLGAVMYLN